MSIISMSAEDANRIFGEVIPTKGQWYEIDTAPKDGTNILVYSKGRIISACWSLATEDWEEVLHGYTMFSPTHWMPLPKPPQEKIQ